MFICPTCATNDRIVLITLFVCMRFVLIHSQFNDCTQLFFRALNFTDVDLPCVSNCLSVTFEYQAYTYVLDKKIILLGSQTLTYESLGSLWWCCKKEKWFKKKAWSGVCNCSDCVRSNNYKLFYKLSASCQVTRRNMFLPSMTFI